LAAGVNEIKNLNVIGVTSVKIIGKYAASGVNYDLKSFIILATGLYFKTFTVVIDST
jgi:hypothetical protein